VVRHSRVLEPPGCAVRQRIDAAARADAAGPRSDPAGQIPAQVATVLAAHGTPDTITDEEWQQMRDRRLAKTANRKAS
jgi:hypothetical protein